MSLPTDPKARKAIPVYSGFDKYFPRAKCAVAELSRIGNDQHNPGQPLHWDRSKSGDELDALERHKMDLTIEGPFARDTDGVLHATKLAWRAMANLEKTLEAIEGLAVASKAVQPGSGDRVCGTCLHVDANPNDPKTPCFICFGERDLRDPCMNWRVNWEQQAPKATAPDDWLVPASHDAASKATAPLEARLCEQCNRVVAAYQTDPDSPHWEPRS